MQKVTYSIFLALAIFLRFLGSAMACDTDADCKGDRVCRNGECSSPVPDEPASATTPPTAPAAAVTPPIEPAPAVAVKPAEEAAVDDTSAVVEGPVVAEVSYVGNFEWVSARTGGGSYGALLSVSAFTLRWRWFYWSILNIAGGGGAPGGNDKFDMGYFGKAGTRVGLPIHLGQGGRHEIRGGVGISGGIIQLEVYRMWWQESKMWYCTSHGPFLDVELMYQFHFFRHFSIVAGYEGTFVFNYVNDNGYPQDNWEPANIHSAFIGIAI